MQCHHMAVVAVNGLTKLAKETNHKDNYDYLVRELVKYIDSLLYLLGLILVYLYFLVHLQTLTIRALQDKMRLGLQKGIFYTHPIYQL